MKIILEPQKYQTRILRIVRASDLCYTHLHNEYYDSKSHEDLPFRLCSLWLQRWKVSLCFKYITYGLPKPGQWTTFSGEIKYDIVWRIKYIQNRNHIQLRGVQYCSFKIWRECFMLDLINFTSEIIFLKTENKQAKEK